MDVRSTAIYIPQASLNCWEDGGRFVRQPGTAEVQSGIAEGMQGVWKALKMQACNLLASGCQNRSGLVARRRERSACT